MAVDLKNLTASINSNVDARKRALSGETSFLEGFFSSAVSSGKEMFGFQPSIQAEIFRAQNPIAGLASELITPVGIYGGIFKAARIPTIAKRLDRVSDLAGGINRPIVAGMAREAAAIAPFEASRLLTAYTVGDGDPSRVAFDVALSFGVIGAMGGVLGALKSGGRVLDNLRKLQPPPGVDLKLLPTIQYRAAREALQNQVAPERFAPWLEETKRTIFKESAPIHADMLLEIGGRKSSQSGQKRAAGISSLFRGEFGKTMSKLRLDKVPQEELDRIGVKLDEAAEYMIGARLLETKEQGGAVLVGNVVGRNMLPTTDPGTFLAKVEDGLFVIAKKVEGLTPNPKEKMPTRTVKTSARERTAAVQRELAGRVNVVETLTRAKRLQEQIRAMTAVIAARKAGAASSRFKISTIKQQMQGATRDLREANKLGPESPLARQAKARLDQLKEDLIIAEQVKSTKLLGLDDDEIAARLSKAMRDLETFGPNLRLIEEAAKRAPLERVIPGVTARDWPTAPVAAATQGDKWLVYMTDRLDLAAPNMTKWRDRLIKESAKFRPRWKDEAAPTGSFIVDSLREMARVISYGAVNNGLMKGTTEAKIAASKFAKSIVGDAADDVSPLYIGLRDKMFELLKPSTFQESRNPHFALAIRLLRGIMTEAESYAKRMAYGTQRLDDTQSAWSAAIGKRLDTFGFNNSQRSFNQIIQDLSPEDFNMMMYLAHSETPLDILRGGQYKRVDYEKLTERYKELPTREIQTNSQLSSEFGAWIDREEDVIQTIGLVEQGKVSEAVAVALEEAKALDDIRVQEIQRVLDMFELQGKEGAELFRAKRAHYGIPRFYEGDFRTQIFDESGRLIAQGAGKNAKASEAQADYIVTELEKQGIEARRGPTAFVREMVTAPEDLLEGELRYKVKKSVAAVLSQAPRRFEERQKFVTVPREWDKAAVLHEYYKSSDQAFKHLSMKAWEQQVVEELKILERADAVGYNELMRRANDIIGVPGGFGKFQNEFLDRVVGRFIGKNSASKIAAFSNQVLFYFHLGFLNPTYALLNVLTPIQVLPPMLSYIQRSDGASLRGLLGWAPVIQGDKALGSYSYIHPWKLMSRAWSVMGNPDAEMRELYNRAINTGTLSSAISEELIGRQAQTPEMLRLAAKSGDYIKAAWAAVRWLPEKSEQVARTFSFTAAAELGRSLGLKGEALYQFANRTTQLTMVNYATVDRARIITGPIGSMFGLFKNWQMNYLGMLWRYAGIGFADNQWGPSLWALAATWGIAGIGGTPLGPLAEGLASFNDNKTAWNTARDFMNSDTLADIFWYGLPGIFGASLQASAALPGANPMRDMSMLFSSVHLDRGRMIGRAFGESWAHWQQTGESPFEQANVRDALVKAVSPRAIMRVAASKEEDVIRSMSTGYPVLRGLSPAQRALYAAGFNPTTVDRAFAVADKLWKAETEMRAATAGYANAYADAILDGDGVRAARLLVRAGIEGVPIDNVLAGADRRIKREQQGSIYSRFSDDVLIGEGFPELLSGSGLPE